MRVQHVCHLCHPLPQRLLHPPVLHQRILQRTEGGSTDKTGQRPGHTRVLDEQPTARGRDAIGVGANHEVAARESVGAHAERAHGSARVRHPKLRDLGSVCGALGLQRSHLSLHIVRLRRIGTVAIGCCRGIIAGARAGARGCLLTVTSRHVHIAIIVDRLLRGRGLGAAVAIVLLAVGRQPQAHLLACKGVDQRW